MDDDFTPGAIMGPAIPSRKTGELQRFNIADQVAKLGADSLLPPAKPRDRRAAGLKAAKTRRQNVAARERAKQETVHKLKKRYKAAKRKVGKHPALAAPYVVKNPNRPLELKHQLQAVLAIAGKLQKAELKLFTETATALQDLSKSGRRRVLEALGRVYA